MEGQIVDKKQAGEEAVVGLAEVLKVLFSLR